MHIVWPVFIFFHIAVNVSMTIGLFPIVGIPATIDQLWRIFIAHFYHSYFYFIEIGCGQADGAAVNLKGELKILKIYIAMKLIFKLQIFKLNFS
jgi:hypothetical protein